MCYPTALPSRSTMEYKQCPQLKNALYVMVLVTSGLIVNIYHEKLEKSFKFSIIKVCKC